MNDNHRMPSVASIAIHPSQFPGAIERDLVESLRRRCVNHKFHYDSAKQTQKWLALHRAYSPSRTDEDCAATYERAFAATVQQVTAPEIHVLGLGCGGGQKDTQLLRQLQARGATASYTPFDVSSAMVLVARETALAVIPDARCRPFVCDLATATDLPEVFAATGHSAGPRMVTFFGMIPNFEPSDILPKLASLIRTGDWLLFSANLAPGPEYRAGLERVLPQYDNPLTHDWLLAFLLDLGVERPDGDLRFTLEGVPGRMRIVARFHFRRARRVTYAGQEFAFAPGEAIQLFFSYRYTPAAIRELLAEAGLVVEADWLTKSEEEGVFFCRRERG